MLQSLPDTPGARIHELFARLYHFDTMRWLDKMKEKDEDGFFFLFMTHFHRLYEEAAGSCIGNAALRQDSHWRRYQHMTGRSCMSDSIWKHLAIIIIAVHTHVKHDIGIALVRTLNDWTAGDGETPSLDEKSKLFFQSSNGDVFCDATIDFMNFYLREQRGYRRMLLKIFRFLLPRLQFIWWPVMDRWRRHSWEKGMTQWIVQNRPEQQKEITGQWAAT